MMTLAEPLTPRTEQQIGCTARSAPLSPRRGRNFFSVGKEPMRSYFSQRGADAFPLLVGERVRVRASDPAQSIVSTGSTSRGMQTAS